MNFFKKIFNRKKKETFDDFELIRQEINAAQKISSKYKRGTYFKNSSKRKLITVQ